MFCIIEIYINITERYQASSKANKKHACLLFVKELLIIAYCNIGDQNLADIDGVRLCFLYTVYHAV